MPDRILIRVAKNLFGLLEVVEVALPVFRLSRFVHQMQIVQPVLVAQVAGAEETDPFLPNPVFR